MPQARVLLVDNDHLFVRRVRRALGASFDFEVAITMREALRAAETSPPDVVVIDPLMSGTDMLTFGLMDALRERLTAAGVAVIYLATGPGAVTRFQVAPGQFYGVVKREAGADGVRDAVHQALAGEPASLTSPAQRDCRAPVY